MQTELRARLLANATISALVGTRVDWGVRPQGKPLPAITLTLVNDNRDQTMAGLQVTQGPLVQVDCWALTYAETVTLREAVVTLLATAATQGSCKFLGAQSINTLDLPESTDAGFVHRAVIRANVWHTT